MAKHEIPGIEYKTPKTNPTISGDDYDFYEIPFYKDAEYFAIIENFVNFVKAVERLVRTSKDYKKYIAYLKNDLGLRACQVLSNIENIEEEDDDKKIKDVTIEMHHGPLLTLFDVVSIVVDHYLVNNKKINTFIIADAVLEEHFNHNIQVVMLSKTTHQLVHDGQIFINFKQGFGYVNRFLKKYKDGLHPELIEKIEKYIERSKQYDSFDNGVLELDRTISEFKEEYEIFM